MLTILAEALDDEASTRALADPEFRDRVLKAAALVDRTYVPGSVPSGAIALILHACDAMSREARRTA